MCSYQVSIPVSAQCSQWIAAEVLRDEFVHDQKTQDAIDSTVELENEAEAAIELFAKFLLFTAQKLDQDAESSSARTDVLLQSLKHFTTTYLSSQDIHAVSAAFDTEVRKTVLAGYFAAVAALELKNVSDVPSAPPSALLTAAADGEASVYALFGGQGTNEVYFDELQTLYDTYKSYVAPYIAAATQEVLIPLASASESTTYYSYGLDVVSWLNDASARPPVAYLASVPISFPLIGLTQLVQYLVALKVARITPEQLRSRLQGATGHSQGLISAVVIAASTTFQSYFENTKKALKWLFFSGLRGQQAFPILAVEPSIVEDSVEGGEGVPSPMLSIGGLSLKELEVHLKKTNAHLPENSQLQVSLHNGPKTFVVTGPPRALYGLVTLLRKVRAPSGLDQSKTPFSQRKPVFSVRFLVVNVPYHSTYLTGQTEKMFSEDLGGAELWEAKDLAIPVYHTENGTLPFL